MCQILITSLHANVLNARSNLFLYRFHDHVQYKDSYTFQVAKIIDEGSKLAVVCYAMDALEVAMEVTDLKGNIKVDLSNLFAQMAYMTWAALKVRSCKRALFEKVANSTPKSNGEQKGLVEIMDKVWHCKMHFILHLQQKNTNPNIFPYTYSRSLTLLDLGYWH